LLETRKEGRGRKTTMAKIESLKPGIIGLAAECGQQ
jgi:hypothetical protein